MKCKYCKQKLKGFFNTRCVNPECPDYYVDGMGQNGVEFSSTKRMEKAKKVEGSSPSNKANRAMQDLKVVAENWTPTKPFVPIIHEDSSESSESSTREQDSSSTPYEKIKDIKKKKIRIENEIQLRRLGYKVTKKKPMIHFISQEDVICMELRQDKKARLQVYYNNNYKVGDEIRCIDGAFIITTMKRVTDVKGRKMYDILSLNQVVERY